jgi:hypothetical protein
LLKHGDSPPFSNAAQVYDTIDKIKTGGRPWTSLKVKYTGKIPKHNVPEWMLESYELWFRDPAHVFADLLANPDFDGEWDSAPLRQYDSSGDRVWKNLMSGNWAWQQCVRSFFYWTLSILHHIFIDRIGFLLTIHQLKAACSARLFWVATRQQSLLQPVRMSTILSTHL